MKKNGKREFKSWVLVEPREFNKSNLVKSIGNADKDATQIVSNTTEEPTKIDVSTNTVESTNINANADTNTEETSIKANKSRKRKLSNDDTSAEQDFNSIAPAKKRKLSNDVNNLFDSIVFYFNNNNDGVSPRVKYCALGLLEYFKTLPTNVFCINKNKNVIINGVVIENSDIVKILIRLSGDLVHLRSRSDKIAGYFEMLKLLK